MRGRKFPKTTCVSTDISGASVVQREFVTNLLLWSTRLQKTFDRPFKELSNGIQFDWIQLKLSQLYLIYKICFPFSWQNLNENGRHVTPSNLRVSRSTYPRRGGQQSWLALICLFLFNLNIFLNNKFDSQSPKGGGAGCVSYLRLTCQHSDTKCRVGLTDKLALIISISARWA